MTQETNRLVADSYPRIATDLLIPLLDLLRLARGICGDDLDKFLVVLAAAIRSAKHREFARHTPEELISGAVPVLPGFGAYARTIAVRLAMPKETVRRKVGELVGAGWLVREGGRLYTTAKCYQELAPVRERIEQMAAQYYQVVARLHRAADEAGADFSAGPPP